VFAQHVEDAMEVGEGKFNMETNTELDIADRTKISYGRGQLNPREGFGSGLHKVSDDG
jgi:hypothetical protein